MNLTFALLFSLFLTLSSSFSPEIYNIPLKIIKSEATSAFKRIPNQECSSDLLKMVSDATDSKLWALQMLDASGKMNPSLLTGNIHFFGNYDECLSIKEDLGGRTIDGQYCTAVLSIKQDIIPSLNSSLSIKMATEIADRIHLNRALPIANAIPIFFGICIPKSCSIEDLRLLSHHVRTRYKLPANITLVDEFCSYQGKSVEITQFDILVYLFFFMDFVIVSLSTIYDGYLRWSGQDPNIFVSFSAYTNLEKLYLQDFNTDAKLACLSGLKLWSCCWVILSHIVLSRIIILKNPLEIITKWRYYKIGLIIWTGFHSLTNFFTISGLMISYFYLKYSERIPVNVVSFYVARFFRLTPPLLATIFVHTSVLKLLADGPYGPFTVKMFTDSCENNWWRVLIYFINWSKYEECAPHTWFLSVDSQLFLVAPLILFFIKKYPRKVLTATTMAILFGIVYSIVVTVHKNLGTTIFEWREDFHTYLYLSCIHHSPSWLLGIILGYLLRQENIKISAGVNLTLWIVSVSTMLQLVFGQIVFITEEYSLLRAALWNGFSKTLWSLCLCFIIYSCATGNGGFMNTLLSHPLARMAGKLTYSMYLIHVGVLVNVLGNEPDSAYIGYFQITKEFLFIMSVTFGCSVLLYLGFEAPIMAIKYHGEHLLKRIHIFKKIS